MWDVDKKKTENILRVVLGICRDLKNEFEYYEAPLPLILIVERGRARRGKSGNKASRRRAIFPFAL